MIKIFNLLQNVEFASPEYLIMLNMFYILAPMWVVTFILRYLKRPKPARGSRLPIISRGLMFSLFIFAFLTLSVLALAKPYLTEGTFKLKKGAIEAVLIVDGSSSMWVKDIDPSRLEIAVREIAYAYSSGAIREGDKVSLIVFGTSALKKLRLSVDLDRFASEVARIRQPKRLIGDDFPWISNVPLVLEDAYNFLDRQDRMSEYVRQYGENPPLDFDWGRLNWQPSRRTNRIVLFFGDGDYQLNNPEDPMLGNRVSDALAEFNRRGLKIFTIGIGTRRQTRLDTILEDYERGTDYDNKVEEEVLGLTTSLNPASLLFLSESTGGQTITIEDSSNSATDFIKTAIESNRDSKIEAVNDTGRQDLWQEFLYAAFFILSLALLVTIFY